jgi:hypothetical protein
MPLVAICHCSGAAGRARGASCGAEAVKPFCTKRSCQRHTQVASSRSAA